jgi:hypothetical protein
VPFYVAAESYKFARIFPLGQRDIPERAQHGRSFVPCRPDVAIPRSTRVCAMSCLSACLCACACACVCCLRGDCSWPLCRLTTPASTSRRRPSSRCCSRTLVCAHPPRCPTSSSSCTSSHCRVPSHLYSQWGVTTSDTHDRQHDVQYART